MDDRLGWDMLLSFFSPARYSQQYAQSRAAHRATPTDSLPPSMACQAGDCHIFADEWEYIDGATVRQRLDEQGNGRFAWKDGRFETHSFIGHTWQGRWSQKEND